MTIELPVFADYPDPNGIAGEIPLPIQKVGDLYEWMARLCGRSGPASPEAGGCTEITASSVQPSYTSADEPRT